MMIRPKTAKAEDENGKCISIQEAVPGRWYKCLKCGDMLRAVLNVQNPFFCHKTNSECISDEEHYKNNPDCSGC